MELKAERVLMPTCHLNKSNNSGFTLIELLVVVALIALITVMTLPGMSSYFRISMNSITREMATTIREAYNSTMVTGRVHRLAMDLEKNKYWVESGPRTYLLHTKESKEKEEYRLRWFSDKKKTSDFRIEPTITRKPISLPDDVKFKDIITQQNDDPITEGMAYIHFFPNGIAEQSIIHLEDQGENQVSLVVSALIGKTKVENHLISKEEAFDLR